MLAASVSLICNSHGILIKTQMQEKSGSVAMAKHSLGLGVFPLSVICMCSSMCMPLAPSFAHQSIPPSPPSPALLAPMSPLLHLTCELHIINLPTFSFCLPVPLSAPLSNFTLSHFNIVFYFSTQKSVFENSQKLEQRTTYKILRKQF